MPTLFHSPLPRGAGLGVAPLALPSPPQEGRGFAMLAEC